jgi:hypothetical protein
MSARIALITSASGFGTGVLTGRRWDWIKKMTTAGRSTSTREPVPDHEQKRVALGYLHEAWAEARLDGIDGDCLAQACLFAALAEFVTTYGEEAAATFTEGLGERIRNGEFSLEQHRQ